MSVFLHSYNIINTLKDEGKREGIELGKKTEKQEIAKNMLKDNVDINTIKKYTNLTEEELTALEEE